MSAFQHTHGDCFDLTPTKLNYWHRQPGDPFELMRAAGLTVRRDEKYNFWHVTGPGVARPPEGHYQGGCGVIWTALSGQPARAE